MKTVLQTTTQFSFFLLPCPFPARTGKLHPPGFWAAVLSGGYLKMDTYFHYTLHRILATLLLFTLSLFTNPMSRTGVPALQTVPSSRRKVLWASCRKDSLLPSDNPVPLFPLRVDAWHSSGSAASLPKLAARFQGQQSPLCTGVK